MKFLRYFLYLAGNWNIRIAIHILRNEIKGEKKYGINSTGADELRSLEEKGIDISHATVYMPASYDLLEMFFARADLRSFNHFLDIGCGKGRAMCVAAAFGSKKISGVELSKDLYLAAKKNLEEINSLYPLLKCRVYNNDAFYYEIEKDVDCIFMFNPFDDVIMSGVLENIEVSLEQHPRKLTVIYINPLQKHLFFEQGYQEIFHYQKMHYLEGSIFEKNKK
ncbi:MAG: class I SAM-dependent methyltransferase [Ferruginibacter sp.]